MRARVTQEFMGKPDGEALARRLLPGDEIAGELAMVAVRDGLAIEIGREQAPVAKPVKTRK